MRQKMKGNYARKRDANEPEIIAALETIPGCTVYPLDKPLDLLVGLGGKTFLLEVKNGAQYKSWQRVTDDQAEFLEWWTGGPAVVVNDVESAFRAVGWLVRD